MKNGVEKRIAFLIVLVMACSLAVPPASADGSATGGTPITITVEDEVRQYHQENPAAWSYSVTEGALAEGDSIEDLVSGPPFCDVNRKSAVGEYPIILVPKKGDDSYDLTIENGTLTIEPAILTSFGPDEPYGAGYYLSVYASDPYNESAASLIRLLTERKGRYQAAFGENGAVDLRADWSADESSPAFAPKGSEKTEWGYEWYSYTAGLTPENRSDAKNFKIEMEQPKAYVRVIPVKAVQTLASHAATLTASDVEALTSERGMIDALNLPETAAVAYLPDEISEPYTGEGTGVYAISGWKLDDGQKFTLRALRTMAAGVADGEELTVTLTPVYAAAGDNAVPAWATLAEAPGFTLTITRKTPADAVVTAPDSITYGEPLGDPSVKPEIEEEYGAVAYRYVGVNGTEYDSADKPAAAGSYRVVARLTSATHSGSWTSETFTIRPKAVTVSGITGTAREYDGTTNANPALDTSKAVVDGMVEGDDLQVTASGYFTDKNAGSNKTVVVFNIALAGEAAGNYVLSSSGNQTRTKANITPRALEVDDSGITVSKQYDGTKSPGTLEGKLKLKGVIGGEVALSGDKLSVGPYANSKPGENKAVTLYGLELTGPGFAVKNYALASAYTFTKAEITTKPRPVLNTDFTVTIPAAVYDGQPHAATVTAGEGVTGLGDATVTYARQRADGAYDTPAAGEPVNAGVYKVTVSFEEGAGFAAMKDRNAVCAGTLTIKKASDAHAVTITVPSTGVQREIRLSALDFPAGMAQGMKIKEAPAAAGDLLKEVTGKVGETAFTLKTKAVKGDQSQDFNLILKSDNYVKLTVAVTVMASGADIEITPPTATVIKSVSEYGVPPEEIISLEGGSASLNGVRVPGAFTLPDGFYDVGKYTEIQVLFNSNDGNYRNLPVKVHAAFTVKKAVVTSLGPDEAAARYITIYANDPSNISAEGLKNMVAAQTGTYTGRYGGGTVELKPAWKAASAAKLYRFNPKGKTENVWYPYTAALTTAEDSNAKNFKIDIDSPTAYVRVIPVNATRTLTPSSASLTAAAVKSLTDETMTTALGLPEKAAVTYTPIEELPSSEFEETSGECAIIGWKMNGKPLTLKALRAKAAKVSGRSVEVTLTPVYASGALPPWATAVNTPVFKLTL